MGLGISNSVYGFYPRNNPSGFITGIDTSNFYTKDNPSGFITGVDTSSLYPSSNPSGFVTNTNLQELQISLSTGIENYTGTFATPFSSVPTVVATMLATQGFNYMAALTSVTTTDFVADFSDVIEETGVTLNIIAYN